MRASSSIICTCCRSSNLISIEENQKTQYSTAHSHHAVNQQWYHSLLPQQLSIDCLLGTSLAADSRDNDPPLDSFMLERLRNGRLQLLKLSRTWHIAISLYNERCSEVMFNCGRSCELHMHANLLLEINDEVHLPVHSHHTIHMQCSTKTTL